MSPPPVLAPLLYRENLSPAAFAVLTREFPGYSHLVAKNQHLDSASRIALYTPRLPAPRAEDLVRHATDPAFVEHLLVERGEVRVGPLERLFSRFVPTITQQRVLATRALSPSTAALLLGKTWLDPQAALHASRRALPTVQLQFIARSSPGELSLEDATVVALRATTGVKDDTNTQSALFRALLARPELSGELMAADDRPAYVAAAIAAIAPAEHHEALLRVADAAERPASLAILGALLDHPSVPREVRREAWQLAERHGLGDDLLFAAIPGPQSQLHDGTPLEAIEDPARIEQLCLRTESRLEHSGRIAQAVVLAHNPYLDRFAAWQVAAVISRRMSLYEACERVQIAYRTLDERFGDLEIFQRNRKYNRPDPPTPQAPPSSEARFIGKPDDPGFVVAPSVAARAADHVLTELASVMSPSLAVYLTSEVQAFVETTPNPDTAETDAWRLIFGLIGDFQGTPRELIESVTALVQAA